MGRYRPEGSSLMGGSGSAPAAPNPQQVAQQQTQSNVETGIANATLGNTNQITPYGSLTYSQTGGQMVGNNWVPSYTATQTLSPAEQKIFDQTTALQSQALGLGPQALTNVGTSLNTPLPDVGALRNQAYDALTARGNQALDLQLAQQKAQLANQGIQAGSDAYSNALLPLEQQRTDIANQGVINAGNVAGQNLAQAQQIHNQPLQDYSALLGFGGGVQQPTYAPASAGQVAATDVTSPAYASYQGQLQQYQQNQASNNALMGGLFGLAGTAAGAALGPFGAFGGGTLGRAAGGLIK
jgi:hypothetical protein